MYITIINDCSSPNEFGRQITRLGALFEKEHPTIATVGIQSRIDQSDFDSLQASGNLIDILDASEGKKGIVLVNVANRHKNEQNKNNVTRIWENGSPFGYFRYKDTLVISTIDGLALSLIKELGLAKTIRVIDIPSVLAYILSTKPGELTKETADRITDSKFRSFDYVPRAAKWLWDGLELPYEEIAIEDASDSKGRIWNIDFFGEAKTTLLSTDYELVHGKPVKTNIGTFTFYNALKDVPNGKKAIIIGSSGIENKRFLEIVIQGKSVVEELGLKLGDEIEILQ